MTSKYTDKKMTTLRIAVPYYGNLIHPQTGMANIYFLAEVDTERKETLSLQMRVWNTRHQPDLSSWLREQNVAGVLCREGNSPHLAALTRKGLWVHCPGTGDAEEMVEQWLRQFGTA